MASWLPALFAFALPLAAVAVATRLLLPWLRRRALLDVPNHRSSHTKPTPRGGGLAVVTVLVAALWVIQLGTGAPVWRLGVLTAAVAALGIVSWIDDCSRAKGGADWRLRLAIQFAAAAAGLAVIGIEPAAARLGVPAWLLGIPLAFAWVWFINLYNFMDGIDGITGVETASIGLGLVVLAVVTLGAVHGQGLAGLALAGAAIGFLVWNWHPARIFLGDVGSVPLGYIVGGLLIQTAAAGQWAPALILPLYYLADATLVLLIRAKAGQKPWQAHKSHFYQRAHQGGMSHAEISLCIAGTNAILILLATAAGFGWRWLALIAALAVVTFTLAFFGSRGQALGAPGRTPENPAR